MRYPFKGHRPLMAGGTAAFTLIEIVIVLLIAGMSVSIAAVAVSRLYEGRVFKEELRKIYRTLKHARDAAVLERAVFIVRTDPEGGSLWLEKDGSAYGKPMVMPEGITVKGEPVVFFPKGNSTGGQIEISDKQKRRYEIEVSPVTGIAKVKRL